MEPFYTMPHVTFDHLSVEVNSDGRDLFLNENHSPFGLDLASLLNTDLLATESSENVSYEPVNSFVSMNFAVEPGEFDKYLGPTQASNVAFDIDQNLLSINSLPTFDTKKTKKEKHNKSPIFLSTSVGVGQSQAFFSPSKRIEIVNDLEETYRPRYKSDYFAQNGRTRKPRYVADRLGNHYVTLKIPPGILGQIRVDWVTIPDEKNKRYFMPYKFQASNDSADILDCNPIQIDIIPDSKSGEIRVYLVLIKAKQDVLKSLQPLRPYQPIKDAMGIVDKYSMENVTILTPKKLIKKYQLGKSQLAFTLCVIGSDGHTCIPDWDTTVFSSIIEEETTDAPTGKTISCPNCSGSLLVDDDGSVVQQIESKKRKNVQIGNEKIKSSRKPNSFADMVYCVA